MLNAQERGLLYQGQLVELEASSASREFTQLLGAEMLNYLGPTPRLADAASYANLNRCREALAQPAWRERTRHFLSRLGLELQHYRVDRLRLRGLAPGAQLIPAAAAAFYAHRDTWYANPQAQINLWMPLHDVTAADSFAFHLDRFNVAVDNDSELFDYRQFTGFQNPQGSHTAVYPRWLSPTQSASPVTLAGSQILLFSAAHLHQSLANLTEQIRYSVDLRLVHREDDARGLGAPNCDNRSRGSAMEDYDW